LSATKIAVFLIHLVNAEYVAAAGRKQAFSAFEEGEPSADDFGAPVGKSRRRLSAKG
jgi:hypothetical protein